MPKKYWLGLLIIGADQLTKLWARQQGWVVINHGISFSWLNGQISWLVLAIITFIIGTFLWNYLVDARAEVLVILAGAIANLIDRIVWGGVLDWWPVPFIGLKNNLADWTIFVGASLIVIKEICKFPLFSKIKI